MRKILLFICMSLFLLTAHAETTIPDEANTIDMSVGGILLDGAGVIVTIDPGYEINQYGNYGEPENFVDAFGEVENNTDEIISIIDGDIAINGYQTECIINDIEWGPVYVDPHHKLRVRFTFDLYMANVSEIDEIENFSVTFKVMPYGSIQPLFESEPVTIIL